jgi:hypothetical protein
MRSEVDPPSARFEHERPEDRGVTRGGYDRFILRTHRLAAVTMAFVALIGSSTFAYAANLAARRDHERLEAIARTTGDRELAEQTGFRQSKSDWLLRTSGCR